MNASASFKSGYDPKLKSVYATLNPFNFHKQSLDCGFDFGRAYDLI